MKGKITEQTFSGTQKQISGTTTATRCICLTQREISFIMKLMAISLVLIPFSSAELDFVLPESASIEKPFTVEISLKNQEVLDVKIFVHNSPDSRVTRSEYISEVKNSENSWTDSWFYLKSAFPEQTEFQVRVNEFSEGAELCIKLRKPNQTSVQEQLCRPLVILHRKDEENGAKPGEEEETNSEEERKAAKSHEKPFPSSLNSSNQNSRAEIPKQEKIILTSPAEIKKDEEIFATRHGKFRNSLVYVFLVLCVFIIVLLSLKQL